MRSRIFLAALIAAECLASTCDACLWDNDTLEMERRQFPDVLELITGKFLRHSSTYYRWRVQDRQRRIEAGETTPEMYDDLAVACDKLGEHQKAIETIRAKDELHPGLYETYANLGTFRIHDGQLQAGVEQIERAIEINPDAHFGREIYQKLLVEYVLAKRKDGELTLPLDTDGDRDAYLPVGFAAYLRERDVVESESEDDAEIRKAVKGVLGMMRFGNHDSPILLEALGDLLIGLGSEENSGLLAARAYLKASYESDEKRARDAYRKMAEQSLQQREEDVSLDELETHFQKELHEAQQWYAAVAANEQLWRSEGKNLDEQFAADYYDSPRIETGARDGIQHIWRVGWFQAALRGFILIGSIALLVFVVYRWRKAKRNAGAVIAKSAPPKSGV